MSDDIESARLPSNSRDLLAGAIGKRLVDIERIYDLSLEMFVDDGLRDAARYFRDGSGPTRFVFSDGVDGPSLIFGTWPSRRSVVLLSGEFEPEDAQHVERLSCSSDPLAQALGGVCRDVRIWTLLDEGGECAVSFVVGDQEIFYVTWLHDDMDSDHVAPAAEVAVDRAAAESLAEGARG